MRHARRLQRLITQAALPQELQRLRVVTPDPAVRQTVLTMPAFRGPNGQFDRQTFEAVLRNNGLTEPRFLDMMRGELAQRQLLGAVSAGAATPETLLRPLYPGPVREALGRHGGIPVRRRARAAGADRGRPATLVRQPPGSLFGAGIPQDQGNRAIAADTGEGYPDHATPTLQAAYEQHKAQYVKPAKRSAEVISVADEAKASGARRHHGAAAPTGRRCRRRRRTPAARRSRWTMRPSGNSPMRTWHAPCSPLRPIR